MPGGSEKVKGSRFKFVTRQRTILGFALHRDTFLSSSNAHPQVIEIILIHLRLVKEAFLCTSRILDRQPWKLAGFFCIE